MLTYQWSYDHCSLVAVANKKFMMYGYYNYGAFSPLHFVFSVIGWVIVFYIIFWVIRMARGKGHGMHCGMHGHSMSRDPGMDTLRERYAKGEIDKKEFEERKKDLMS